MAPPYFCVSPEAMQYAPPTVTSGDDHEYPPWKFKLVNRVSGSPPVLPVRSPYVENSSWDSLVDHAFYVPQADPCLSNLPSLYQPATAERERSFRGESINPQVIASKWNRTSQESCTPAIQIPPKVINRGEGVWIPTGAPLAPQPLALNSLRSPIKLEGLTDKANEDMDAPDLEFDPLSSPQSDNGLFNYSSTARINRDELCDRQDEYTDRSTSSVETECRAEQGFAITGGPDMTSNSQPNPERAHFNLPKRQLSYGQIQRIPNQKTLYRSMGSRQLRNQVDNLGVDRQQTFPTSPNLDATRDNPFSSMDCLPLYRKPRIWIDATRHEEKIEEAHLTAITSPPRPHIITIPRRSSSLEPRKASSNIAAKSMIMSDFEPVTPPETPVTAPRLQLKPEKGSGLENGRRVSASLYGNGGVPLTPPNSPTQTPRASLFHQQKSTRGGSKSLPCVPSQCEPTPWVLNELEIAVASFPEVMLRLDLPVIQHLRLNPSRRQLPKPLSKIAKASHLLAPHSRYSTRSRYSIFRPLSSHPLKGQFPETPKDVDSSRSASLSLGHSMPDSSPTTSTLNALQAIFPQTSVSTLECLQAAYVALHYLFAGRHPRSLTTPTQAESMLSLAKVPPKAREMLGMQSSIVDPAHTFSWLRPTMPEHGHDSGTQARVVSLAAELNAVIRDILGSIEGRQLDGWDEAFVRTVGEVVRLGERRSTGCRMEAEEGTGLHPE